MLTPKYEVDRTIQYSSHHTFYLNTLRDFMTLTFDHLTLES